MGNKVSIENSLKKKLKLLEERVEVCLQVRNELRINNHRAHFLDKTNEFIALTKSEFVYYLVDDENNINDAAYSFLDSFPKLPKFAEAPILSGNLAISEMFNLASMSDMDWLYLMTLIPELSFSYTHKKYDLSYDMMFFLLIFDGVQRANVLLKKEKFDDAAALLSQVELWVSNEYVAARLAGHNVVIEYENAKSIKAKNTSEVRRKVVQKKHDSNAKSKGYNFLYLIYKTIEDNLDNNSKISTFQACMEYVKDVNGYGVEGSLSAEVLVKLHVNMTKFQYLNVNDIELESYKRVFKAIEAGRYEGLFE